MTTLGINATTSDTPTTWTGLKSSHPSHPLQSWVEKAWLIAGEWAEELNPDWEAVREMQGTAIELERYIRDGFECTCSERGEMSCPVCRAIAKILYRDY